MSAIFRAPMPPQDNRPWWIRLISSIRPYVKHTKDPKRPIREVGIKGGIQFAAVACAVAMTGCASARQWQPATPLSATIPIPPSGDKAGQLGTLYVSYEPNLAGTVSYFFSHEPSTKGLKK